MLLLPRQQFQSASVESWAVKPVALRHLPAASLSAATGDKREVEADERVGHGAGFLRQPHLLHHGRTACRAHLSIADSFLKETFFFFLI